MEIWHPLSPNTWLYAISKKTMATISCNKLNSDTNDIELDGLGILTLNQGCKCYTFSSVLYASSNQTSNFTNYIPSLDINKDDLCLQNQKLFEQKLIQMDTLKIDNANLDELRHSKKKLDQFDEFLAQNMQESFLSKNLSWFATTTEILCFAVVMILSCCCCCNCSWLPLIGRFFPKYPKYCGLPSICITNHNERFELSDSQLAQMNLNRLQQLQDENEASLQLMCHSTNSPKPTLLPYTRSSPSTSLELRPRRSNQGGRFHI
ncbi:hypothetical protein HHI36_018105 [Cryptolaemus montrouzieri]|uniref:Uncharacterized protein n=1 Tax=Cryptolaemus montrouzieri TaxID=559131 RepID=A0ABD2NZ76_9CUCU